MIACQVSIEALRSQDLTQQLASAAPGGTGKASKVGATSSTGLSWLAKYPLIASVELDGTGAGLARVVARLTAINEVMADTD